MSDLLVDLRQQNHTLANIALKKCYLYVLDRGPVDIQTLKVLVENDLVTHFDPVETQYRLIVGDPFEFLVLGDGSGNELAHSVATQLAKPHGRKVVVGHRKADLCGSGFLGARFDFIKEDRANSATPDCGEDPEDLPADFTRRDDGKSHTLAVFFGQNCRVVLETVEKAPGDHLWTSDGTAFGQHPLPVGIHDVSCGDHRAWPLFTFQLFLKGNAGQMNPQEGDCLTFLQQRCDFDLDLHLIGGKTCHEHGGGRADVSECVS